MSNSDRVDRLVRELREAEFIPWYKQSDDALVRHWNRGGDHYPEFLKELFRRVGDGRISVLNVDEAVTVPALFRLWPFRLLWKQYGGSVVVKSFKS